ncbi:MAG: hypothetical protein PETM_02000 [Petrimonas sp.]
MKIIVDTNIWISFVIGKRLSSLQKIVHTLHRSARATEASQSSGCFGSSSYLGNL